MADNKTPHPPTLQTPQVANDTSQDVLWLVSYADDDDRELTAQQIAAALERGEIDANTIVWRDGMTEWKAIAEVDALRSQLRKVSHAPENLRRRQTQLGGFGPAQPLQPGAATPAPPPATPAAPGLSLDDDEPTVIQSSMVEGFSSAPNQVRPEPTQQRGRHPTSGNTLRIKTSEPPPVTPRAPSEDRITPTDTRRADRFDSAPRVAAPSDPDLESLPSALLVTATGAAPVTRKSSMPAPPAPTRGVMSRQSDPPGTPIASNIPRAALTRDPDSDMPPAPKRGTEVPRPPAPGRADVDEAPQSVPSDAVQSVISTRDFELPKRTPEGERLPSVQVREDYAEADLARQRTRPPRNRREGWVESGTPPPIGELSEAAARIAQATSHPPAPLLSSAPPPPTSSNGRWIGLALFGAAAVAGAFALGKRSGESATTPSSVMTTQSAVATTPAPTQPVELPGALDPAATAPAPLVSNQALAVPAPVASAKGATPRVVANGSSSSTSLANVKPETKPLVKPTSGLSSAPAPQVSAPAIAEDSDKPAEAAPTETKPSATPGVFDSSAAATALGNAASRASSCRQPGDPSGVARVTVTFANSGSATHAIVDGPPFAGTATGGCIAATMRGATVPAFTGDRVTVKKTVVIQ